MKYKDISEEMKHGINVNNNKDLIKALQKYPGKAYVEYEGTKGHIGGVGEVFFEEKENTITLKF